MDVEKFPKLMTQLYLVVAELEGMFGRSFTPDGHMVGSLGEALAAHYYGLTLTPPSTAGCDAIKDGKRIEIKATQGTRVSFRREPEYLLVMKIEKDGSFEEIYNGLGNRVWNTVAHKTMPSNGQHQISLPALRRLAARIKEEERLVRTILSHTNQENWDANQETRHLLSVPGLQKSIKESMAAPLGESAKTLNW